MRRLVLCDSCDNLSVRATAFFWRFPMLMSLRLALGENGQVLHLEELGYESRCMLILQAMAAVLLWP